MYKRYSELSLIIVILSICAAGKVKAELQVHYTKNGFAEIESELAEDKDGVTFWFDDYVSNPQPGNEAAASGFIAMSKSGLYIHVFTGFVDPEKKYTTKRPLPEPVGVIVESKFWPVMFHDSSVTQVTSDIRGRKVLMFRFVAPENSQMVATVSKVAFRLWGAPVAKKQVNVQCFDLSNKKISSDIVDGENLALIATKDGEESSLIHTVLFTTDSDDIWGVGSNDKDVDVNDMVFGGIQITSQHVDRRYTDIPNPFDPYEDRWIDPRCEQLYPDNQVPLIMPATVAVTNDGSLMTYRKEGLLISTNKGVTWQLKHPSPKFKSPGRFTSGNLGKLIETGDGTLVVIYVDYDNYVFDWAAGDYNAREMNSDIWSMRSLDGGKTWVDRQKIFDGFAGGVLDLRDIKQISTGRIVLPISVYIPDPGRFGSQIYFSDDEGKSWSSSNIIDLGGKGNHDGACEGTFAELADGRLLLLLRTSWDRLWKAYSTDQGQSWRVWQPTQLDASSAPGYLLRLSSSRLVFIWNRLYPEGLSKVEKQNYPRTDPPQGTTGTPASWHRTELSMVFSEDNGESWTEPIIIARQPNAMLAYPYMIEYRPGEIWLFTQNNKLLRGPNKFTIPGINIQFKEDDFIN